MPSFCIHKCNYWIVAIFSKLVFRLCIYIFIHIAAAGFHYQAKVSQMGNPFSEGYTFRDMPFPKRRRLSAAQNLFRLPNSCYCHDSLFGHYCFS